MTSDQIIKLAGLLVDYHNAIDNDNASILGARMDKALCRDTFTTLYRHVNYETLKNLELGFEVKH